MNYSSHAQLSDLRVVPVRFYDLHSDTRQFKFHRPMNLQRANLNRLDVQRRDLRDLKGLGPLVATAQGPRPFKSRRSLRCTSNLYLVFVSRPYAFYSAVYLVILVDTGMTQFLYIVCRYSNPKFVCQ